jgi:hypothetical protein
MPHACRDLDGMDRAACSEDNPLEDPAGIVEGQEHSRTAQHQENLPSQRVGVTMRPDVAARLDGHAKTLDRVRELGVEVVMGPFPRRLNGLGRQAVEDLLRDVFHVPPDFS